MRRTGSLTLLTAIVLAALLPAVAQAASWTLQSAPIPTGAHEGSLTSISCAPTKACMAVGTYEAELPYADEEEGGKWTIRSMAMPTGATGALSSGVSCFSKTACVAVGRTNNHADEAFAEFWNGTSWTLQSPIEPAGAELTAVSCIRSYACYAVGSYTEAGKSVPLAEFRSGSEWAQLTVPNPTGSEYTQLKGVSCTFAALYTCTAVGVYQAGHVAKQFAERYNGHTWSIISTINPTGTISAELSGISCYGVNECLAVGRYETSSAGKTLIERLGPTLTSLETSANGGTGSTTLLGVSCPTSEGCLAVGSDGEAFSEHLESGAWASIPTLSEPGSLYNHLNGVSCPAVAECVAVGIHFLFQAGPLAEGYA
jgi:hypothetical protein